MDDKCPCHWCILLPCYGCQSNEYFWSWQMKSIISQSKWPPSWQLLTLCVEFVWWNYICIHTIPWYLIHHLVTLSGSTLHIASDNVLLPVRFLNQCWRCQVDLWQPTSIKFKSTWSKYIIQYFSWKKIHLKISAKLQSLSPGLNLCNPLVIWSPFQGQTEPISADDLRPLLLGEVG